MKGDFDAVIIGGGHNGLVAASLLAQAGKRVLVLERRQLLGGIAATEEILPGVRANTGWPGAPLLHPDVMAALQLDKHGFEFSSSKTFLFAPHTINSAITLWRETAAATDALRKTASGDASAYPRYLDLMRRMAGVLSAMMVLTPPPLKGTFYFNEIWPWLRVGLRARGLGRRDLMEFLRLLPLSAAELLDEWFESVELKGALALFSTLGTMQGPMGGGTALNLLYRHTGRPDAGFVRGGSGELAVSLLDLALSSGVDVRVNQPVDRILVDRGRVAGVQIAGGDTLLCPIVISTAGPGLTLMELVDPEHLPVRTTRRLRNVRYNGSTATVHLLLSGLPDLGQSSDEQLDGYIAFCPSVEYLEKAYDDAKYGRLSGQPALLGHMPSLRDDSFAPSGKHVLSLIVRYAPYHLRGRNWEKNRANLEKTVLDTLSDFSPGLVDQIEATRVITPLDYERVYSLQEGAWNQGQMALDQLLMMRPVPGMGSYRSPISGLYLSGSGTHPGGEVTGAPGMNVAREVLRDLDPGTEAPGGQFMLSLLDRWHLREDQKSDPPAS